MPRTLEHVGYLLEAMGNRDLGEHPLLKSIRDFPPDGYEFQERPQPVDSTKKPIIEEFVNRWYARALELGVSTENFQQWVSSRDSFAMLRVPPGARIWSTDIPYYFGPEQWMTENEDWTHLMWPFLANNHPPEEDLASHPATLILKAQMQLDNFRGIVTHIKDMFDSVRGIFGEEMLRKTYHAPLGHLPVDISGKRKKDPHLRLLFYGSSIHSPIHFFLRGGQELLEGFNMAYGVNPEMTLTIVYERQGLVHLEGLKPQLHALMMAHPGIRYLDRFLSKEEMNREMLSADAVVLPAYRVHSYSVVGSMMHALPVIATDGWGFSEFLTDGYNGLIAEGNHFSWKDENGIMRERYCPWGTNYQVAYNLSQCFLRLADDPELCVQMAKNAREHAMAVHSIEARNKRLKEIFDQAYVW